ncbi:hypothetical protein SH449x_005251 [Pirellulaceae bacterium SH449]
MTHDITLIPYTAPTILESDLRSRLPNLQLVRLGFSTFFTSLFVIVLLQSFVWQGHFRLYSLHDQAHFMALIVSAGLAIASCVSHVITRKHSFRYSPTILVALLGITAIGVLTFWSWPIMIPPSMFIDLSKVFAVYTAIGLIPALLVSLPQMVTRAGWTATASLAAVAILALFASMQ